MKYNTGSFIALLAMASVMTGCSMDMQPVQTSPSQDVREYYLPLERSNVKYNFTVESNMAYTPKKGELVMDMQGASSDTYDSKPVYVCNWIYTNFSAATPWYYVVDKDQALGLGVEINKQYTQSWVELKAPLDLNKTWTFVSEGETITATVVKFGATAKVQGATFNNVMMVEYKGDKGTQATEWFAKGKGLIYNHYSNPKAGYVHNELERIVE